MLDMIKGSACDNCESAPATDSPYCSTACKAEAEGVGETAPKISGSNSLTERVFVPELGYSISRYAYERRLAYRNLA